jgi:hypothetical protein
MYPLPLGGEVVSGIEKLTCDLAQSTATETIVFAQLRRGAWKFEFGFAAAANHVDMRRLMVVGIHDHPQFTDPHDRWHMSIIAKPNRLGYP